MERTEVLDMMTGLKLYGMRSAYDETLATAIKRKHEPQRLVGDLLKAEISEKQARSIKYQLTVAKLPLAKDVEDFTFKDTPINEAPCARSGRRRIHRPATQCRPGRRTRHRQDASGHRDRRPGDRASSQARPLLLHRRTRQRSRTREASGQARTDRGAAHSLRSRHPRRARLPAVQRLRRTRCSSIC